MQSAIHIVTSQIKYRIIADLVIFPLLFIGPWWLSVLLIFLGIFLFQNYYESLIFAVLLDGYYGVAGVTFFGLNTFFVSIIAFVFLVAIFLKPRLTFY